MKTEQNTDLIPLKVHGVLVDPNTDTQIVILRDETNEDILPIWVGTAEGTSIRSALEGHVHARPMSHDLITSLTNHLGMQISHVTLIDVKNNTYFANVHIASNGIQQTVDSRPSDAIALALRTKSPIYVTQDVLKRCSRENLDAWLAKLTPQEPQQSEI